MTRRRILTFCFALAACLQVNRAQSFLPVCRNFGPEDYNEDVEFRCATSDHKGTMYFGTNYGILVYKGEKRSSGKNWRFMLLPQPDVVLSLYMDTAAKRLYVGGQHDFGYFQLENYLDGEFVSLKKAAASETPDVWHIEKCGNAIVFHCTSKLMVYAQNWLKELPAPEKGIFHNVFKVDDGLLVNALDKGWFHYAGGKLVPVESKGLPADKCYAALRDKKDGQLIFFFRNIGVYKVTFTGNAFVSPQNISDGALGKILAEKQVYAACFSADGKNIIIGTLNGGTYLVQFFDQVSTPFIISEMQTATNVQSVYGLYTDPMQNIWILGKRNLSLLPADLSLAHQDLKGTTIKSLALYRSALYMAASTGLYKIEKDLAGFFSQPVLLREGPHNKIVVIGDTLYASTPNELVICAEGKVSSMASEHPVNDISCVQKQMWISTTKGCFTGLDDFRKNRFVLSGRNVLQVLEDERIYALLDNEGVVELDRQGEVAQVYKMNNDFASTQNARLFADRSMVCVSNLFDTYVPVSNSYYSEHRKSRLWLLKTLAGGRKVRFEFDSTNSTLLQVGSDSAGMMTANSFMSPVEVNDAVYDGGYYYLATKTGLYISKLWILKPRESVHVFKLTTGSEVFYDDKNIRIDHDNNRSLTISCALNSFYSSYPNTYYIYRLVPYDSTWTAQATSEISFGQLPWGDFTLEVKARYGNDQETELARFRFSVLKPWWATWWAILLWVLLFLLFVYAIVQISVYRLKQAKIKLEQVVKERTAEVVHQKNEIEAQKEEIEHKNLEITDSINYAQHIQNALLKSEEKLKAFLPGAFVLYMPKDIVSGDFYWYADIGEYKVMAVADCTGHGVPGAFMSMLGVAKLNELAARNIYMPNELLHELNHLIVETLGQNQVNSESRDGMDMAVVSIHEPTRKLYYAGANRPMYIVARDTKELSEIKPTKLPVGGGQYGEHRDYALHEQVLEVNHVCYLTTDGYADQFGGPGGKKMMSKRLHALLIEIVDLPHSQQRQKLEAMYLDWKGKLEQVDDVCLVGLCFST